MRKIQQALSLAAVALALAGCSHGPGHGPGHMGAHMGGVPAGGFSVAPASFGAAVQDKGALCVGREGQVAACSPRPQPKFDIGALAGKPLVDVGALPQADQPAWVLCRLDYREKPPRWECVEVYNRLPR